MESVEKDTKMNYKDNIKEHRIKDWTEKPLHRQYSRLVADTSHKTPTVDKEWIYEEKDRKDVDSSSRPGIVYKVEKETHWETDRDIYVQTVWREKEATFHILCECSKIAATE